MVDTVSSNLTTKNCDSRLHYFKKDALWVLNIRSGDNQVENSKWLWNTVIVRPETSAKTFLEMVRWDTSNIINITLKLARQAKMSR